jgi:flagellar biosynthesis protein FlhB
MNKQLRYLMIKSAHERVQMQKKHRMQKLLLEREIKQIEGDANVQK